MHVYMGHLRRAVCDDKVGGVDGVNEGSGQVDGPSTCVSHFFLRSVCGKKKEEYFTTCWKTFGCSAGLHTCRERGRNEKRYACFNER